MEEIVTKFQQKFHVSTFVIEIEAWLVMQGNTITQVKISGGMEHTLFEKDTPPPT